MAQRLSHTLAGHWIEKVIIILNVNPSYNSLDNPCPVTLRISLSVLSPTASIRDQD